MNAPRPFVVFLIVVAVALVGFYVLGTGTGLRSRPKPRLEDLKDSLGEARPLALGELPASAGCRRDSPARLSVARGAACAFQLPSARAWQRRALVLRPSSGPGTHVKVEPAGGERITVEGDPDQGKWSEFSIPSAGAKVRIECAGPATTCLVDVCGKRPCS